MRWLNASCLYARKVNLRKVNAKDRRPRRTSSRSICNISSGNPSSPAERRKGRYATEKTVAMHEMMTSSRLSVRLVVSDAVAPNLCGRLAPLRVQSGDPNLSARSCERTHASTFTWSTWMLTESECFKVVWPPPLAVAFVNRTTMLRIEPQVRHCSMSRAVDSQEAGQGYMILQG